MRVLPKPSCNIAWGSVEKGMTFLKLAWGHGVDYRGPILTSNVDSHNDFGCVNDICRLDRCWVIFLVLSFLLLNLVLEIPGVAGTGTTGAGVAFRAISARGFNHRSLCSLGFWLFGR